ncbi:hypothetical protein ES703_77447 [subsurface metagenome]
MLVKEMQKVAYENGGNGIVFTHSDVTEEGRKPTRIGERYTAPIAGGYVVLIVE